MPHLTLEYTDKVTQEVDFCHLFSGLHGILADLAGIRVDNCKSRCVQLDTYQVGLGEGHQAFVHLTIRILDGRPLEVRQEIGRQCMRLLEGTYGPSMGELELQITVEVAEVQPATYFKIPEGTLRPVR